MAIPKTEYGSNDISFENKFFRLERNPKTIKPKKIISNPSRDRFQKLKRKATLIVMADAKTIWDANPTPGSKGRNAKLRRGRQR